VVDTLSTAISLELLVNSALEAVAAGATRHEVVKQIEERKKAVSFMFLVDTLEYLAKGGRIGNARAFLGTLLKVKPILMLEDGAIEPLEQVRSKRKAQARMVDLATERIGDKGSQAKIAITNALAAEEAKVLRQDVEARLGCAQPIVSSLGPVIGTHTGPGAVGIAWYT
jgi:DegV family protein with EDD domain